MHNELCDRSVQRMDRTVTGAITIAFVLFEAIGLSLATCSRRRGSGLNFSSEYVSEVSWMRVPLLIGRTCIL